MPSVHDDGGAIGIRPLLALMLLATLLGLGAALGRMTAPPPAHRPSVSASGPDANAGDSASKPPPAGDRQPAPVGPTREVAGVPVGYRHNRAGAVAAATAYVTAFDGAVMFDADRRAEVLDAIAAHRTRAALEQHMAKGAALMANRLNLSPSLLQRGQAVVRDIPAGYQVSSYDGNTATVRVWTAGVMAIPGRTQPPDPWGTATVRLVWESGDWKLSDLTSQDGPTPPSRPDDALAVREIAGFTAYRYLPIGEEPS